MMLPSPDSTGAQNHDRKPNGIPLDSVRPENALARPLSACHRLEPVGAGDFYLCWLGRSGSVPTTVLARRTAHDPPEGGAEGAFGFIAQRARDDGNRIA